LTALKDPVRPFDPRPPTDPAELEGDTETTEHDPPDRSSDPSRPSPQCDTQALAADRVRRSMRPRGSRGKTAFELAARRLVGGAVTMPERSEKP
jgi:hypothetical protein